MQKETETETDSQKETETYSQRETDRDRKTDRDRQRHRRMAASDGVRILVTGRGSTVAAPLCLLLLLLLLMVGSGVAQQLTVREMEFLRDSGLMRPEDVAAAYDRQLSPDRAQLYRSAVKKLMDGEDRQTVETFLNMVDANALRQKGPSGGQSKSPAPSLLPLGASPCSQDVCKNMAICMPSDSKNARPFTCLCPDGYFGETCQYDVVECVRQPCLNDGDCRKDAESNNGYTCICPVGFAGTHCENPVSLIETKRASEDVAGDPIFLSYVAMWCVLVLSCGLSFVMAVEAERRVLFERYKLYTALGYAIPFPRLQFCAMTTRVWRRCLCCLGWCIPNDDMDSYPEIPNSAAQRDGRASSNISNVNRP